MPDEHAPKIIALFLHGPFDGKKQVMEAPSTEAVGNKVAGIVMWWGAKLAVYHPTGRRGRQVGPDLQDYDSVEYAFHEWHKPGPEDSIPAEGD